MKRSLVMVAAVMLLGAQVASAALKINEIYFSPEDPKDDRQFFEIISDTGGVESLNDLWLLEIDGEFPLGTGDNPGQVLNAFNLTGFSTGANGLFLWRDSTTVLDNSNAPGVQGPGASGLQTQAFNQQFGYEGPNEEFLNNVHTFLLVQGFTGTVPTDPQDGVNVGDDLDNNNDGTLDSAPWTSVLDGVGEAEDGDAGHQYAGQVGGIDVRLGFGADVWHRLITPGDHGAWAFFDSGSGDGEPAGFQGPFFANDGSGPGDSEAAFEDGTEIPVFPTSTFLLATPGAANLTGVPEPHSLATVLVGAAVFAARSRRRHAGR